MMSTPSKGTSAIDIEANTNNEPSARKMRNASKTVSFMLSPLKLIHTPRLRRKQKHEIVKDHVIAVFDSPPFAVLMTMVTIYSLYSENVRLLAFDKSLDIIFVVFSSLAFFLFIAEIAIKCLEREGYMELPTREKISLLKEKLKNENELLEKIKMTWRVMHFGSFYFWLDLIATLTMIFELPWIIPSSAYQISNTEDALAGQVTGASTGATRLVSIVRIIRLVRLVRLYKYFSERKRRNGTATIVPVPIDRDKPFAPTDSHVGAEMSDRTTKKVIIGILIMLFFLPYFQAEELAYLNEFGMSMVFNSWMAYTETAARSADEGVVSSYRESWGFAERHFFNATNCVDLSYSNSTTGEFALAEVPPGRRLPSALRPIETEVVTFYGGASNAFSMRAEFDISSRAKEIAFLDILLTTFVILLLAVGNITFSRDVNTLVIIPIEKMVQMVREISLNPLGKELSTTHDFTASESDGAFETVILFRTISKLAALMRIGFGEAGAEVIGRNLNMASATDGGSGGIYAASMNLLGHGRKIQSVFAFCDIRNFTDTTECLQEEVMLFVNRIAHILHSIVVQCDGAANKNIGDAFLLTWKVDPAKLEKGTQEAHGYIGDKALLSLLKTFVEMIRNEDFICNFTSSNLTALYERMPGYACRIGCGFHFGWAIEGAIGTDEKIDASYISPHVNWSECLEAWTKDYGVPLLMSEPFYNLLSPNAAKYCRQLDRIKKGENDVVTSLYTYDANLNLHFPRSVVRPPVSVVVRTERKGKRTNTFTGLSKGSVRNSFYSNLATLRQQSVRGLMSERPSFRKNRVNENTMSSHNALGADAPEIVLPPFTVDVWDNDQDLVHLRMHVNVEARQTWDAAMKAYLGGDWGVARALFHEFLHKLDGNDGPSKYILKYMERYNFSSPSEWRGYRDLCAKCHEE